MSDFNRGYCGWSHILIMIRFIYNALKVLQLTNKNRRALTGNSKNGKKKLLKWTKSFAKRICVKPIFKTVDNGALRVSEGIPWCSVWFWVCGVEVGETLYYILVEKELMCSCFCRVLDLLKPLETLAGDRYEKCVTVQSGGAFSI